MRYSYSDRERFVRVELDAHPWKYDEALEEIKVVKHILNSLKNRLLESSEFKEKPNIDPSVEEKAK